MVAGERPTAGIGAVASGREPDDDERSIVRAERRDRPTEVAGIGRAHLIEEGDQPCAATAAGIVRGRRRGFWQNVGSLRGGHAMGANPSMPVGRRPRRVAAPTIACSEAP